MIIAVSSVKDEACIIERTVTHLLGSGVDEVIVSDGHSTDETKDILAGVCTVIDQDGPFDQAAEITRLAQMALGRNADWVIPFDADEFWCAPEGDIAEVLNALPPQTDVVHAPVYQHFSMTRRAEAPKFWGKACFRPNPGISVVWGNHGVAGTHGVPEHGLLQVRELQYQSWEHFLAKVEKSRAYFASWDVPSVYGQHMRLLVDMNEDQLRAAWEEQLAIPTVEDPIPYRGK